MTDTSGTTPPAKKESASPARPIRARDTAQRRTALETRYAKDIADLNDRLTRTGTASKKRDDRIMRLFGDLGDRMAKDHAFIAALELRVIALEQNVEGGMSLNLAAAIAGFTTEEIRAILDLKEEDELTDSAIAANMMATVGWLRANVNTLIDASAETRGIVNDHTDKIATLTKRVDEMPGGHKHEPFPAWGFVTAAIAWFFVSIIWSAHTWRQKVAFKTGNTTLNGQLRYRFLNSGWMALAVGFGVACVVIFVVSATSRYHARIAVAAKHLKSDSTTTQGNEATTTQPLPVQPDAVPVS